MGKGGLVSGPAISNLNSRSCSIGISANPAALRRRSTLTAPLRCQLPRPRLRLILTHVEHAPSRPDLSPDAPPGDKRAGELL
jgi:hypothetical protein